MAALARRAYPGEVFAMNAQSGKPQGGIARHYVDTMAIPDWGTADDGARVRLSGDAELQEEYAAWAAQACDHPAHQQYTGRTVNAGGVDMYRRYCKACGAHTTQNLSYRSVEGTAVRDIDPAKRDAFVGAYIDRRRADLDGIANRAANRAQPQRRRDYTDYLSSSEWKEIRAAVLDRCEGKCEGCRKSAAVDVHHLTYAHIGAEFLFELVGLCRGCHERLHDAADEK